MMKKSIRFIALFLSLVLFVSSPVSADDYVSQWISILKYDIGVDNGNTLTFSSTGTMEFILPESVYMRRLQGVISANLPDLTSVSFSTTIYGQKTALNLVNVGSGLYRFYSNSISITSDTIYLHFSTSSVGEPMKLELVSFDYSTLYSSSYAEIGTLTIGSSPSYTMSTPTSIVTHEWPSHISGSFVAHFTCADWKMYDSLSFFVYGFGADINSVVGRLGNSSIPVTVSYLDASNWEESRYSILVTLDLSGVDRTSSTVPEVEIAGFRRTTDSTYFISLLGVTGYVFAEDNLESDFFQWYFEELTAILEANHDASYEMLFDTYGLLSDFFFSIETIVYNCLTAIHMELLDIYDSVEAFSLSVSDYFESLFLKLEGFQSSMESLLNQLLHADQTGSEQFEEDVASQATEFEDIAETIDDVTKPPVDDLDPSVDDLVSPSDVQSYTSVLGVLLGNQIFLSVCLMSLTFALVSYTIYGKR